MSKHLIKIKQTPESVVNAIRYVEIELQDNFLEYHDIFVDASVIMNFAYKKGYITEEKFKFWEEGFENNEIGTQETFEVILGESEEWEPYCIAYEDTNSDKDYNEQYTEALKVYGELVCSEDLYYSEFVKILKSKKGNLMNLTVEEIE